MWRPLGNVHVREQREDNTNVSIFRQLKGKGIIPLIKSARIHQIRAPFPLSPPCFPGYLECSERYPSLSQGVLTVALNSVRIHKGTIYQLFLACGKHTF